MEYFNPSLLQKDKPSLLSKITSWLLIFITVLLSFVIIANLFFFEGHPVEGPSMLNTIKDGDKITVCKWKEPERGDIVIIELEGKIVIKRVIAFGGERVRLTRQGEVYISPILGYDEDNNPIVGEEQKLEEPYLSKENIARQEERSWDIPQGYVFYMGDNRAVSLDSRNDGPVKESQIIGVVSEFFLKIKDEPIYKNFLYYVFI